MPINWSKLEIIIDILQIRYSVEFSSSFSLFNTFTFLQSYEYFCIRLNQTPKHHVLQTLSTLPWKRIKNHEGYYSQHSEKMQIRLYNNLISPQKTPSRILVLSSIYTNPFSAQGRYKWSPCRLSWSSLINMLHFAYISFASVDILISLRLPI